MQRRSVLAGFLVIALAATACGGDDDSAEEAPGPAAEEPAQEPDAPSEEPAEEPAAEPAAGGGGSGSATLVLDNGEQFEFSILCNLESQMAAGSEILFTVVSYDDIGLDITKFGDEGTVTDAENISVYGDDFETLWDAGTLYEPFGGAFDLALDGSTVTGSGDFYPGGDFTADPVAGEIVANC